MQGALYRACGFGILCRGKLPDAQAVAHFPAQYLHRCVKREIILDETTMLGGGIGFFF